MTRSLLNELQNIEDPVRKRATFIGLLTEEVVNRGGRPPIVVGGEAVELYSQGSYTTGDIDLKAPKRITEDILREWDFEKKERCWFNRFLDIYIDWLGESLDEGAEAEERVISLKVEGGRTINIISIEDLIVDRLNASKWWKDTDSLMWARVLVQVKERLGEKLDMEYLCRRAEEEDIEELISEIT